MRVLVIGAGLMGRIHADVAQHLGATVVGIHDVNGEAAASLAAKVGATSDVDLATLVAKTHPVVAHVCTPAMTHGPFIHHLLDRHIHAIVEKPFVDEYAEAEALLTRARAAKCVVCPVHQFLFQGWTDLLPKIGEVLRVDHATSTAGAKGLDAEATDRLVDEILPHPLSIFERVVAGSTINTFATLRPQPGELATQVECEGIVLRSAISTNGRPTRNELTITGSRGTIHADLFHGHSVREGPHTSRAYKIARPFAISAESLIRASTNLSKRVFARESAYPGLRNLVRAVYAQIEGGAVALSTDHVLRVVAARERMRSRTLR